MCELACWYRYPDQTTLGKWSSQSLTWMRSFVRKRQPSVPNVITKAKSNLGKNISLIGSISRQLKISQKHSSRIVPRRLLNVPSTGLVISACRFPLVLSGGGFWLANVHTSTGLFFRKRKKIAWLEAVSYYASKPSLVLPWYPSREI